MVQKAEPKSMVREIKRRTRKKYSSETRNSQRQDEVVAFWPTGRLTDHSQKTKSTTLAILGVETLLWLIVRGALMRRINPDQLSPVRVLL